MRCSVVPHHSRRGNERYAWTVDGVQDAHAAGGGYVTPARARRTSAPNAPGFRPSPFEVTGTRPSSQPPREPDDATQAPKAVAPTT